MTEKLRILLVDEHPVVRDGLRANLSRHPDLEIVGETGSGTEALRLAEERDPDVMLTDLRLSDMNGLDLLREMARARPRTMVIVLTMYQDGLYFLEALRSGAAGYLLKESPPELIVEALRASQHGGAMVPAPLLRTLSDSIPAAPGLRNGRAARRLTEREMQVLRLLSGGYANKAIAAALGLAEATVKKYVQRVVSKLGASDRTHAAAMAVRMGLVE